MDKTVADILEKVKETAVEAGVIAGRAANAATKMANEVIETTKINLRIRELDKKIQVLLMDIGSQIYQANKNPDAGQPDLEGIFLEIDSIHFERAELQEKLKKPSNKCPSCDAKTGKNSFYCSKCGEKLV